MYAHRESVNNYPRTVTENTRARIVSMLVSERLPALTHVVRAIKTEYGIGTPRSCTFYGLSLQTPGLGCLVLTP